MSEHPSRSGTPYGAANVRSALGHFLGGRLAGSLMGVAATLLIARELPPVAYGAYAVLLGFTTLVGTGSAMALDHTAQRFLPELVATGEGLSLRRLLWKLVTARIVLLAVAVVGFVLTLPLFAPHLALAAWLPEARLWGGTILAVVGLQYLSGLLEVFLLQRYVKWLLMGVSALRLSMLVVAVWRMPALSLGAVAAIELLANALMIPPAFLFLRRGSREHTGVSAASPVSHSDKPLRERIRMYWKYAALREWVVILAGPAANRLIMGNFANITSLGAYGFAQTIIDFVQRYLPSVLLRNMIRPVAMAKFSEQGSYAQIDVITNITLKLNVAVLVPLCVAAMLVGSPLVTIVTDGKYPQSAAYIVGFAAIFLIQSHYFLVETYANASEHQKPLFIGSLITASSILPAFYLVPQFGIWGLLIARAGGILIRDIFVTTTLRSKAVPCSWDFPGTAKLLIAGALAFLILYQPARNVTSVAGCLAVAAAAGVIFGAIAMLLRPFRLVEKQLLNGALGRRLVF